MGDPDGRKIFVTHRKPHLDEVVAAWLLRSFDPVMTNCDFDFVTNTPTGGDVPPGDQYVPVGVGRGKYDEHGRQVGHSACQLVYEDLLHRGLIPNDEIEKKAIEVLVNFTHREDTGQFELVAPDYISFSIPAILRGFALLNKKNPSPVMMDEGLKIIAAIYINLKEYAKFLIDWDKRIDFESIWGKAVAVHSSFRGSDVFAYHHGYVLRVQTDPVKPFGDFRGPANSQVDLTPIYDQLIALEPDAWYLHQSKKILLSNSDSAARPVTKFTLQQLINFVKKP